MKKNKPVGIKPTFVEPAIYNRETCKRLDKHGSTCTVRGRDTYCLICNTRVTDQDLEKIA